MSGPQSSVPDTVIELAGGIIEIEPGGFLHIIAKPMVHDLASAREVVDWVKERHRADGRKFRLIVDMRQTRSLSRDARLLYQSEEYAASLIGAALMIDSGVSRVIGNFAMKLNQGPAPTRLFTSEDEARAWLEGLPDE